MERLRTLRSVMMIGIVGAIIGGIGVHRLEAMPLLKLVADGFCTKPAFQTVLIVGYGFYNCQDTVIANEIQLQDASDPIADIIRASENVGKKAKRK